MCHHAVAGPVRVVLQLQLLCMGAGLVSWACRRERLHACIGEHVTQHSSGNCAAVEIVGLISR
jgi:hypothetical protein